MNYPLHRTGRNCKFCNASAENAYEHDENCLINLPGKFTVLSRFWKLGYERQGISGLWSTDQRKVYHMGLACVIKYPEKQTEFG
jgi:hypothetical protein